MSILFVGNFLSAHGVNRTAAEALASQFVHAGHSVLTTSSRLSRLTRLLDMLWTVIVRRREYQIAYIEVYSGLAFRWAELVGGVLYLLQKPIVLALRGGNLPFFASQHPRRVERLLRWARAVVAPSRYLQEALRPYRQDILLIPNPLNIKEYPFRLRVRPEPRLIWLRAFHVIYNPVMAVKMMVALRASLPEIQLTMIGPDKDDGSLTETRKWVEQSGLENAITIISGIPKNQVPSYLSQADIFINTTNIDNTPISVMEAMACGLCVVSTNVGGISYLLEDRKDALLVLPDDWQGMADAIKLLYSQSGLASLLAQNARNKVGQFDWSVVFPQWENLFLELSNRGTN